MEDTQRSLEGPVAISEARVFDPAKVQVSSFDQPAIADFSKVQYLEISDSETEGPSHNGEDDKKAGSQTEDAGGLMPDQAVPDATTTSAQKRKKDKRKNKNASKDKDEGGD
ncbi:hypothetical protein SEPCBS57363_003325 [Sporothrix epigloea]|uniref:Uncharacterized protein n=1 Tax=Sporothrix epigloea TaxID=1892477 RepID=A0ABP0DPB8_9PEZI